MATAGFENIIDSAIKKRLSLVPAIAVHDAIIAYAKAKDIELLYDHYQESFYDFLDKNYGFRFPFDLEIATNYYDKIVMEKEGETEDRTFTVSGTHKSLIQVLERAEKYGKKIEYFSNDNDVQCTKDLRSLIKNDNSILDQYIKTGGVISFDRDFSYGSYKIRFVD